MLLYYERKIHIVILCFLVTLTSFVSSSCTTNIQQSALTVLVVLVLLPSSNVLQVVSSTNDNNNNNQFIEQHTSTTQQLNYHYQDSTTTTATTLNNDNNNNNNNNNNSNTVNDTIPSWEELDDRTIPSWYDESKIGIFIHWGVFSVPAYRSEWFWKYWQQDKNIDYINFVQQTETSNFNYIEYASKFRAEFYNPKQWASIFAASGAQYIVLTSKHHDGYCLWNSTNISSTYNWNTIDIGPQRDVLGELATEIKQTISPHTNKPIHFGVYHSLYEWFNPMYLSDKKNNFTTTEFIDTKILPELYELVTKYQPELIWSDGEWEATSTYWKSREFLNWYTTQSSVAQTAIYNDRWGNDVTCQHGSFRTCIDRYNPDTIQSNKYENAFTIDSTTWGYSRYSNYSDYMTIKQLVHTIIQTVAMNGNVLINIGPAADGTIHPIFVDRLLGIGDWLKVNGEAIYETKPWQLCPNETQSNVYYTTKNNNTILYAHFTKWPEDNIVQLHCPIPISDQTKIHFVGLNSTSTSSSSSNSNNYKQLEWKYNSTSDTTVPLLIMLPLLTPNIIPCQHAWVLRISNVAISLDTTTNDSTKEKM